MGVDELGANTFGCKGMEVTDYFVGVGAPLCMRWAHYGFFHIGRLL